MSGSTTNALSIVCAGHVHTEAFEALTRHLSRIEQVVTNLPPRAGLAGVRAELNRAVDAAAHDWILVMREREEIGERLAAEIATALGSGQAWGYRIAVLPLYAGRPLRLATDNEVRLFHRRHLLRRGELQVEGSVVRMREPVQSLTFPSAGAHRAYLQQGGTPRSTARRLLTFLRNARTFDANTLRYLWIEAGFSGE